MVTTGMLEKKRLDTVKANGIFGKHETIPLTIFILILQFALMGVANTFLKVEKLELLQ